MDNFIENPRSLEEIYNDYEKTPVPESSRKNWAEQGMIWLGEGFGLSGLAVGGILAQGLSFKEMFFVSIVGSFIVWILASICAFVSTHTHLATSIICRRPFGVKGAKIIGVIICLCNFGWYAFQADLFGHTVSSIVKQLFQTNIAPVIFTIIGGLLMATTAIFGIKAIKLLSQVGMPLLFILCGIAIYKTGQMVSFGEIIQSSPIGDPMSIPLGISVVVSSFAVGIAMIGDFARFSKSHKDSILGISLGYFWGYIPVMMCGAYFTYAFNNWNIVEVMIIKLGLGIFATIVLVVGQWTTNDNNLYGSVLGLMNTLDGVSKIPRMKLTLILGAISTALAALGVYKYFIDFLSVLGVIITPITGILISDFFICNRKSYNEDWSTAYKGIKWDGIGAWLIASFVGIAMTEKPMGLGLFSRIRNIIPIPIISIIITMVLYTAIQKCGKSTLENNNQNMRGLGM